MTFAAKAFFSDKKKTSTKLLKLDNVPNIQIVIKLITKDVLKL